MKLFHDNQMNERGGTTRLFYIESNNQRQTSAIIKDQCYLLFRLHDVYVSTDNSFFKHIDTILLRSKLDIKSPERINYEFTGLQTIREKQSGGNLGLSKNLSQLLPAVMDVVTISVDLITNKKNYLAMLNNLVNDQALLSTIASFMPGAGIVAQAIGEISEKLINAFVPAEEREPVLQFNGDFNIATNDLKSGFYAVLSGARGTQLPLAASELTYKDGCLLFQDKLITDLSYIIFEIVAVTRRGSKPSTDWYKNLVDAERIAKDLSLSIKDPKRRLSQWSRRALPLLQEARMLIMRDPEYITSDANAIIDASLKTCMDSVKPAKRTRTERNYSIQDDAQGEEAQRNISIEKYRSRIGIKTKESLDDTVKQYAIDLFQSRETLDQYGIEI